MVTVSMPHVGHFIVICGSVIFMQSP